jgi:predicted nuclease of predicted toxin-antitoxin system
MDVHVPAAITAGLRHRQVDVLTSQDDGTVRFTDNELLMRATNLGRVLFTQDADFLQIVTRWQAEGKPFCGVVYCHQLATGIGQIINDMMLVVEVMSLEELSFGVIFLPF